MTKNKGFEPLYPRRAHIPLDAFSGDGTFAPEKLQQWAHWLQLLLFVSGSRTILEIGTGCGYLTAVMAEEIKDQGGWILTMDNGESDPADVRSRWEALRVSEAIQSAGDDPKIVLEDRLPDSFDCIVHRSRSCLEQGVFQECLRLLRIGGLLVVLTPSEEPDSQAHVVGESPWLASHDPLLQKLEAHPALEVLHIPGSAGLLVARKPEPIGGTLSHEYLD